MDTNRTCPGCQKLLTPNAPQGLCPECLIKAGLGTGVDIRPDSRAEGGQTRFVAPTLDELVKPFPQLEILSFIGQGGMGAVYKARQKALDRIVALKILPPGTGNDPAFAERFTREAKALAALNHPNIVTIHDFGQAGGFYYLLMEFVDGVNLRQAMKAARFTPEQALAVVPPICEALQYAHEHGIVHRDIKPENLLLDKAGRVMIADFGVAKMLDAESLEAGFLDSQPAGTPQYMAPEQKDHRRTDHRADIYSLGVVLYEMLTGELPGKPIEPPSHKVQIDVRLDAVVLRALEQNPSLRYQQVSDVKTMVETIATTPPAGASHTDAQPAVATPEIRRQVKGPAIGLLVTGMLNWIAIPTILAILANVITEDVKAGGRIGGGLPLLMTLPIVALVLSSVMIFGALKMKQMEGYGWAIASAILAIVIPPGNIIGLPLGIWALLVLRRPGVRTAFRQPRSPQDESGKPDWRAWSPFQAPLVREICANMTEAEKREATKREILFSLWNVGTFFGPWFCIMFLPAPLTWVCGIVMLLIGLSFYPLFRKMEREFLCTTAWARQQRITLAQLGSGLFLVGRLNGQAVIRWPAVLLAGVSACATAGFGVLAFYIGTQRSFDPVAPLLLAVLGVGLMLTLRIRRSLAMPVERLVSLDAPQVTTIGKAGPVDFQALEKTARAKRFGKIALALCLGGLVLPVVLHALCLPRNSWAELESWVAVIQVSFLCELAALVLGIIGWKSDTGKAAVIVAVVLPFFATAVAAILGVLFGVLIATVSVREQPHIRKFQPAKISPPAAAVPAPPMKSAPPPATPAPAEKLSFGPVIEQMLPNGGPDRQQYFQFGNGEVFSVGRGSFTTKEESAEDWKRITDAGGMDMSANSVERKIVEGNMMEGMITIHGAGCFFTEDVPGLNWATTTAEEVAQRTPQVRWTDGKVGDLTLSGLPVTYLFKTAHGDVGLMEVLGVVEDERGFHPEGQKGCGMKFRYKLLQGAAPLSAAAQSLSFGPVTNGLQAAVELQPASGPVALGEPINLRFYIRNVSDHKIVLAGDSYRQHDDCIIEDKPGHRLEVFDSKYYIKISSQRGSFGPGEVIVFESGGLSFFSGNEDVDTILASYLVKAKPGHYTVCFRLRFDSRHLPGPLSSSPDDWRGDLVTAPITMEVQPPAVLTIALSNSVFQTSWTNIISQRSSAGAGAMEFNTTNHVLTAEGWLGQGRALDLETGNIFSQGEPLATTNAGQAFLSRPWNFIYRESGGPGPGKRVFDVRGGTQLMNARGIRDWNQFEGHFIRAEAEGGSTAEFMRAETESLLRRPRKLTDETSPQRIREMPTSLPMTFLFGTYKGSIGVLQITGFTTNPRGVKIRYKLVQTPSVPNAPALESTP